MMTYGHMLGLPGTELKRIMCRAEVTDQYLLHCLVQNKLTKYFNRKEKSLSTGQILETAMSQLKASNNYERIIL